MGSKIGIIFAFLLSLAAAAGAYLLYQNLTQERVTRVNLEKKYDEVKEEALTLQSEKEQIKAAKEQYQSESLAYQRKVKTTETQLNQLKSEASRVFAERSNLAMQLKEKENRLAEMERKVAELQKQTEEAMRACKITPSDVKASAASSDARLVFNTPTIPTTISSPPPAPSVSSMTSVSGTALTGPRVLTVNRKFNFVVVNMGIKDGVKMGEQLKVLKSGAESATLQVEKLYDKFSAATIISENSRDLVKEGDAVRKA